MKTNNPNQILQELSAGEKSVLEKWASGMTDTPVLVQRARIILSIAAGKSLINIGRDLGVNQGTIRLWRDRFLENPKAETLRTEKPGRGRKTKDDELRPFLLHEARGKVSHLFRRSDFRDVGKLVEMLSSAVRDSQMGEFWAEIGPDERNLMRSTDASDDDISGILVRRLNRMLIRGDGIFVKFSARKYYNLLGELLSPSGCRRRSVEEGFSPYINSKAESRNRSWTSRAFAWEFALSKTYVHRLFADNGIGKSKEVVAPQQHTSPKVVFRRRRVLSKAERLLDEANDLSQSGNFDQANEKFAASIAATPKSERYVELWNWGYSLASQARRSKGEVSEALFADAYAKFDEAVEIEPMGYEALCEWGVALTCQAESTEPPKAANELFTQAFQKFRDAVRIQPKNYYAYYNWGIALGGQVAIARAIGKNSSELFTLAYGKFAEASAISPYEGDILLAWGKLLVYQAVTTTKEDPEKLYALAHGQFDRLYKLTPTPYKALRAKAYAFSVWAERKRIEGRVFHFNAPERLKPDGEVAQLCEAARQCARDAAGFKLVETSLESARILEIQATRTEGKEADNMTVRAEKCYATVLELLPRDSAALISWGNLLRDHAETLASASRYRVATLKRERKNTKTPVEHLSPNKSDELFQSACDKYQQAIEKGSNTYFALSEWGITLSFQAENKDAPESHAISSLAWEKCVAALLFKAQNVDLC